MKVMVAGEFGLEAEKLSQDTVELGVTGMSAAGELVTVTGACTGPPFWVALK
jgi:hypothetical protein